MTYLKFCSIYNASVALLFQICGLILTVMGIIMVLRTKDVSSFAEMVSMNTVAIATLAIGSFVVTISLLGSFGTLRGKAGQLRIVSFRFISGIYANIYVYTYVYYFS